MLINDICKKLSCNQEFFTPPPKKKPKQKTNNPSPLFILIAFDIKAYPVLFRYHDREKSI